MAYDVAVQQGQQVVSELLSEYERHMHKGSQGDADHGEDKKQTEEPKEAAAAGNFFSFLKTQSSQALKCSFHCKMGDDKCTVCKVGTFSRAWTICLHF